LADIRLQISSLLLVTTFKVLQGKGGRLWEGTQRRRGSRGDRTDLGVQGDKKKLTFPKKKVMIKFASNKQNLKMTFRIPSSQMDLQR